MSLPEIEIVSDSLKDTKKNTAQVPAEVVIFDVFGASAYGDLQKLKKFVEEDGVSLSQPDGNGYYPLQWASLNNFPHVVHYILEVYFLFCFSTCVFVLKFLFLLDPLLTSIHFKFWIMI